MILYEDLSSRLTNDGKENGRWIRFFGVVPDMENIKKHVQYRFLIESQFWKLESDHFTTPGINKLSQ